MRHLRCPACLLFGVILGLSSAQGQPPSTFPAPKDLGDPAKLGLGIQRTMTLLATSTPQKRNTVKILFYGQSITEQGWWKIVADDLRRRFPHANLIVENRALGGFASQRLVNTAETDLYPFYPDLMIFYVYGSHIEYENIIRRTRERTTAEILMQTDHATADANLTEPTDPAKLFPDGKIWNSFMNYRFLPETARKYGCGLVDQRNLWKRYLKDHQLPAPQLLRDGVHLNAHGDYLMAELVKAYLVRRDEVEIDPFHCETVKTFVVGKDIRWENGKLAMEFEGNRVDVILASGGRGTTGVRIDGNRPSERPELYRFTRALPRPGGKWPVVTCLRSEKPPILETWTLEVTRDAADGQRFSFTLTGSKTGPDGQGRSDQRFVSDSGRVAIAPENWDVAFPLMLAGVKPPPSKFTVRWEVVPAFVDQIEPPASMDPAIETVVTVAQGLAGRRHRLELDGGLESPVAAVRVYCPPRLAEAN